ncbi:unnamed protein product [Amaranthus hypochondriacus]
MAGRGRGRPPKKKAEQHASSRAQSVSSEAEESSNSERESETLNYAKTQSSKPSTQSTTPSHALSGWIEAVQGSKTKSKEVRGIDVLKLPSMADGQREKPAVLQGPKSGS